MRGQRAPPRPRTKAPRRPWLEPRSVPPKGTKRRLPLTVEASAKSALPRNPNPSLPARRHGRGRKAREPRLELIGRPQGSTLAEILKVTQWQAHSVRGFLSTAAKKH